MIEQLDAETQIAEKMTEKVTELQEKFEQKS